VPIIDLYGHESLRARLSESVRAGTLPSSLLFQGLRGVGKQRLALWLAERLLCTQEEAPCEKCTACRYARAITHPDLHWVFPRPRLKDADPDREQVRDPGQVFSYIVAVRSAAALANAEMIRFVGNRINKRLQSCIAEIIRIRQKGQNAREGIYRRKRSALHDLQSSPT